MFESRSENAHNMKFNFTLIVPRPPAVPLAPLSYKVEVTESVVILHRGWRAEQNSIGVRGRNIYQLLHNAVEMFFDVSIDRCGAWQKARTVAMPCDLWELNENVDRVNALGFCVSKDVAWRVLKCLVTI